MLLPGVRGQFNPQDDLLDFSGTITSGGTAQLLLNQQPGRAMLQIENISSGNLFVAIGPAKCTAVLSGTTVASVTVNNGGLGYTVAPQVVFLGGVNVGDLRNAPTNVAVASATLSGGAVNAVTMSNLGGGYSVAPYVWLVNPAPALGGGAFTPSATAGYLIVPNGSLQFEGTGCPSSAVAIFGATTGQGFTCSVMF